MPGNDPRPQLALGKWVVLKLLLVDNDEKDHHVTQE